MKKIIDGKLYDTDTAAKICSDGFSFRGDFSWWCETLYFSKKGQFFFHGEGGPLSRYGISVGNNSTSGSESLWLVDVDDARQFVFDFDVDLALKMFDRVITEG